MKKRANLTAKTLRFYFKHIRRHKFLFFLSVLGVALGSSSTLGLFYVVKLIVDQITVTGTDVALSAVTVLLWPFFGILILNLIGWRLGLYSISLLEAKCMTSINEECFDVIHKQSFDFFNNRFVGALVKQVSRMVHSIEGFLDTMVLDFLQVFTRIGLTILLLSVMHPVLGIVMILWATAFIYFNVVANVYKLEHYSLPALEADSKVTGQFADTVSNSVNVKLFATKDYERKRFLKFLKDKERKTIRSWFFAQHLELVQNLFMIALEVFILYFMLVQWHKGAMSVGDFVLVQGFVTEMFIFIWDFGRQVRRLYETFADAEEMTRILNRQEDIKDAPNAKTLKVRHGAVEFKSVSFSYDESESVVKKTNFTIKPGEKIGLIGPSGGGKTTIIKLLLRLFDLDSGRILIDGQNIAKVTQASLRAQITLVPQDPVLFHRSLKENIRYGRLDATDEEVYEAAKMAHCHEFISEFPDGYETLVGERGIRLSGGERQRVAIARAILSNSKILVLDEATSQLDVRSEELIQDALKNLIKDKTTIVIAHRLSTVVHMDRIIVIENGEVVETGSHKKLIQKKNGLYRHLWAINTQGRLESPIE